MSLDDFLNITYKRTSSDNFSAYLETMGVAEQIRELMLANNPTVVLTKNGDTYCLKTSSAVRDHDLIFTPGEEFDHVGIDGRSYRAIITMDGNKLTNKILSNPQSTVTTDFTEDRLVVNFEANGVEASQIYEKV